jgi:hypothetical protein
MHILTILVHKSPTWNGDFGEVMGCGGKLRFYAMAVELTSMAQSIKTFPVK